MFIVSYKDKPNRYPIYYELTNQFIHSQQTGVQSSNPSKISKSIIEFRISYRSFINLGRFGRFGRW